ncbi:MAG: START-like domain-containing protein [Bacteroidota bacterium]
MANCLSGYLPTVVGIDTFALLLAFLPRMSRKPKNDTPQKQKIEIEFNMHSSVPILFNYISTPTGLQSWFADQVSARNQVFHFEWEDGSANSADLVKSVQNKLVRFHWTDSPEDEYFEFHIVQDELTGDVELMIIDFCLDEEQESTAMLWESQVEMLRSVIGA